MNNNGLKQPIGLDEICLDVNLICANYKLYQNVSINPSHYLIGLDQGNGQTTLTEYIAGSFYKNKIRRFGGLDIYLEYIADGSLSQLKQIFNDIKAHAVYLNNYEGCVSIDITELSSHVNEIQMEVLSKELKEISNYATVILYVPSKQNRNINVLCSKVKDIIHDLKVFLDFQYTDEDIANIMIKEIKLNGIYLDDSERFKQKLRKFIIENQISKITQAIVDVKKMIKFSCLKDGKLSLSSDELELYCMEEYGVNLKESGYEK